MRPKSSMEKKDQFRASKAIKLSESMSRLRKQREYSGASMDRSIILVSAIEDLIISKAIAGGTSLILDEAEILDEFRYDEIDAAMLEIRSHGYNLKVNDLGNHFLYWGRHPDSYSNGDWMNIAYIRDANLVAKTDAIA